MANLHMHRREALQKLAILLGGTLSFPVQAALRGEKINSISLDILPDQRALISQLAEVILPETDTPGATKAGVDKFIVRVIEDCTAKTEQEKFLQGLQKVDFLSQKAYSKPYTELDNTGKTQIMSQLAREDTSFFLNLRELTIVGFFTSELGVTQALAYLPVPGKFHGDLPLAPGQRAWAI